MKARPRAGRLRFPKPPKRAAKEPKPLARRATPRARRRGGRAALKRKCDQLWSRIIRASNGGRCKLAGQDHVRCGGPIQAAHCFGRGHHSVRHELWNGWAICAGHHVYYTHHPEAWTVLLINAWGDAGYYGRHWRATDNIKPDYAAIAAELQRVLDGLAA